MPAIPDWALALTFWIHFLAAVTLVGSLVAAALLVLPAARALDPLGQLNLIASIQKRMEPAAWFSISLLIVTGLFQMSVNIHYNGFLSVSNQWTIAILVKHVLVVTMIVVSAVQTWDVLPSIRRLLLRKDKASQEEALRLQRREAWLLRANLILAVLILGATAVMRAA
ncbi:MAG TPA: CopD family protein [Anaerolineales bacterium]|nr:CopD family protein [Anaerolineales bacterium]